MKRALDIGLAGVLTIVLSPLIVVLALGAALSLRSWPFFAQRRVGRNGNEFWVIKIRTLPRTTAAYANKYDIAEVETSRFCAGLRRLHLDELPQVVLVLFGSMSLVGPRPEMRVLHDEMDPAFARLRTSVRPGCSGLWQIGPAAGGLIGEVPEYDRFYVEHATVRLDLWILWRTCRTVTRGGGERTLSEVPAWAIGRPGSTPVALPVPMAVRPTMTPSTIATSSVSAASMVASSMASAPMSMSPLPPVPLRVIDLSTSAGAMVIADSA